jgi:hypothetical protein
MVLSSRLCRARREVNTRAKHLSNHRGFAARGVKSLKHNRGFAARAREVITIAALPRAVKPYFGALPRAA